MQETEIFYPESPAAWRQWLQENHNSKQSVWVVFYKKASSIPTLTWSEAVDEALCFGWIDSKKVSIDHEKSHQFFCRRKAKSTWSKINKLKIERLTAENKMTAAGLLCIDIAKENGSWTLLDTVEELLTPDDLEMEFTKYPNAKTHFDNHSKSVKKILLAWIVLAKTAATREKRIQEIAACSENGLKPKGF